MINHETTLTDALATFAADVDVTYRASDDVVRRSCIDYDQVRYDSKLWMRDLIEGAAYLPR